MASSLPTPKFTSCDETSLKLKIEFVHPDNQELRLQYKEPHVPWEAASEVSINNQAVAVADVVDLKPGTPYFVRLVLVDVSTGSKEFGPDTVFDTKPIDCTPKQKKCIIS